MRFPALPSPTRFALTSSLGLLLAAGLAWAGFGPLPMSLKGVPIPPTPGLLDGADPIVIDKTKAIVLGKALFWDVNVGSDGMACASCHFHAGADRRVKNQIAPSGHSGGDERFAQAADGQPRGANYRLRRSDFPLNQANEPLREIDIHGMARESDDVVGSAGIFAGEFRSSELMETVADDCARQADSLFHARGIGARQATRRNAPTVINAVFNHRNFWDGRANNVFNGSSPWGDRDPDAGVWVKQANGAVVRQRLRLLNASLASQAVAPPLNTTEMACTGRALADLGRKLQLRAPLENQIVHPSDSVLGFYAHSTASQLKPGLKTSYAALIRQAFNAKYWSSNKRGPFGKPRALGPQDRPQPYSQMEANFGLFFALAIQLYESTLVSDDSPFDRSARDADGNPVDLDAAAQRGMHVFREAHCATCHVGPVFTTAAASTNASLVASHPEAFGDTSLRVAVSANLLDHLPGNKGKGFVDVGFAATGVAQDEWDVGLGGSDPFGHPYSYAEQYLQHLAGNTAGVVDAEVSATRPCDFTLPIAMQRSKPLPYMFVTADGIQPQPQDKTGCLVPGGAYLPTPATATRELANPATTRMLTIVEGAFKVPSLRNAELTGPYMHNGGMASLEEVVEFYARGGNFEGASKQFALVFPQPTLQLDASARSDLVQFLKSLTDDRVRFERAPFDHPELPLITGQTGDHWDMPAGNPLGAGLAPDEMLLIPAVGAAGLSAPLPAFEEYLDD